MRLCEITSGRCRVCGRSWSGPEGTTIKRRCGGPRPTPLPSAVDLLITCGPGYHQFLPDSVGSALAQQHAEATVTVVADRCPEARDVMAQWPQVRLLQIDAGSAQVARRTAFHATSNPLVMFLDADDVLPPDYAAAAVDLLRHDQKAAIAYSDLQRFGDDDGCTSFPARVSYRDILRSNCIHSGAVTWRRLVDMTQALDTDLRFGSCEDWRLWRSILAGGLHALKMEPKYLYRQHSGSRTASINRTWSDAFAMHAETITVLIPLSGRSWAWPGFADWLDRQTWPRLQVDLRLLDTSARPDFGRMVRHWCAECDYPAVTYRAATVAAPGLADLPRRTGEKTQMDVNAAMLRIWHHLALGITTPLAVTIEDDILPPLDAIGRMVQHFTAKTDAVALPYRSRYSGRTIPPNDDQRRDVSAAPSCGFGCTAWRTDVLQAFREPARLMDRWCDVGASRGRRVLVDWSCECEHRDAPGLTTEAESAPAALSAAASPAPAAR